MNTYVKYILWAISLGLFMSILLSCSDDDKDSGYGNINMPPPNEKFDGRIYVVSKLTDGSIASDAAGYSAIGSFLKKKKATMGNKLFLTIVDRTDATYSESNMFNGIIRTSFDSDLMSTFALNKINGKTFEGSTLLLASQYVKEQSSVKVTNSSYLKMLKLSLYGDNTELEQEVGFDLNFRTARFSTSADVDAFTGSIFRDMKASVITMVMVGTVKKDLVQKLSEGVKAVDDKFFVSIHPDSSSSDYAVFFIAHEGYWGIKKTSKEAVGDGINAYEFNIMW